MKLLKKYRKCKRIAKIHDVHWLYVWRWLGRYRVCTRTGSTTWRGVMNQSGKIVWEHDFRSLVVQAPSSAVAIRWVNKAVEDQLVALLRRIADKEKG